MSPLLSAFFAVAAWGQSQPQQGAPSRDVPSTQTTQPSGPDQRGTDQVPLTVKIQPATGADEKAAKDRQEKAAVDDKLAFETERIARYTLWLSVFTGGLTLVAGLQAALFIWQLRLIKDESARAAESLALAREQFNATHRPELAVRETFWAMQDMDGGEVSTDDSIMFTVVNRGQNSCTIAESAFRLTSGAFSGRTIRTRGHNHLGRINFAVGQFRTLNFEIVSEEEGLTAAARTLSNCFFRGTIIYEDPAQVRRRLVFSRICERGSDRFVPTDDPEDEYTD